MNNIFVSFFGDGRLADNISLTAAFPVGFSYFRPFRYRTSWIHEELSNELNKNENFNSLLGSKAFLTMRFLDENFKWLLLPIREITITYIDNIPENVSVYFTFGPLVDFSKYGSLREACIEISSEDKTYEMSSKLFFRSKTEISPEILCKTDIENEIAWAAYTNLIANDASMPINEYAKNSVFLRILDISEDKEKDKKVEIMEIYKSYRTGKKYGPKLKAGNHYEIGIIHKIPILIGKNKVLQKIEVSYEISSQNVELNKNIEDYSSNYQVHYFNITAKKQSGTTEEIVIIPNLATMRVDDDLKINFDKLPIAIRVENSFWYTLRTVILPIIALWLLFSLSIIFENIPIIITPFIIIRTIILGIATLLIPFISKKVL